MNNTPLLWNYLTRSFSLLTPQCTTTLLHLISLPHSHAHTLHNLCSKLSCSDSSCSFSVPLAQRLSAPWPRRMSSTRCWTRSRARPSWCSRACPERYSLSFTASLTLTHSHSLLHYDSLSTSLCHHRNSLLTASRTTLLSLCLTQLIMCVVQTMIYVMKEHTDMLREMRNVRKHHCDTLQQLCHYISATSSLPLHHSVTVCAV